MIIPESLELHVGPASCGRRMYIGNLRQADPSPRAHLFITEEDVISGCYEDLIPDAIDELLEEMETPPRAVIITVTCIDDLLGTDHIALQQNLERRFPTVRFCIRKIDPICFDGGIPPMVGTTMHYLDMLDWKQTSAADLNLVGNMSELTPESEIFRMCAEAGLRLHQIPGCPSFDAFLEMGDSCCNIAVTPIGLLGVQEMEQKYQVPYLYHPRSYRLRDVVRYYREIEKQTGVSFPNLEDEREQTEREIQRTRQALGSMSIAVDSSIDLRSAALARALLEYGFRVRLVISGMLFDGDRSDVDWLVSHQIPVVDERNFDARQAKQAMGECMCLGFSGGYLLGAEHLADFPDEEFDYGFYAMRRLMQCMREAAVRTADYASMMKESEAVAL